MKLKNDKGITLVALTITIAVMTILLGTVLVIALNDNGIINSAKDAKDGMEEYSIYQSVTEAVLTSKNKNGKVNEETLKNKLKKIDQNASLIYDENTKSYASNVKGMNYIIEEYGEVTKQETTSITEDYSNITVQETNNAIVD